MAFVLPEPVQASVADHPPIVLDEETDLLLPDSVSGNGVRSGTGLPGDPFLIQGWRIASPDSVGILIKGIRSHVRIEGVEITPGQKQSSLFPGIEVRSSEHVEFRDIKIQGRHSGIYVVRTNVTISGVDLSDIRQPHPWDPLLPSYRGWGPAAHALVIDDAHRAELRWVHIRDATVGLSMGARQAVVEEVLIEETDSALGLGTTAAGGQVTLRDATIANKEPMSHVTCYGRAVRGDIPGPTQGLELMPSGPGLITVENVRVTGFRFGIYLKPALEHENKRLGETRIHLAAVFGNGCGMVNELAGSRASVTASDFHQNDLGVFLARSYASVLINQTLSGSRVWDNRVGVMVETVSHSDVGMPRDWSNARVAEGTHDFETRIWENSIVANREAGLVVHGGSEELESLTATNNYWGDCGPRRDGPNGVEGPVVVEPYLTSPTFGEGWSCSPVRQTAAPSAAATAFAAAVGSVLGFQRMSARGRIRLA